MAAQPSTTPEIHQSLSFRVVVVRVIESIVYDSIDATISLTKMTSVINNHPLIQHSLHQITRDLPTVTIRDVILSITKIFQASQISILKNNDNFKLKMDRVQFKQLIDGLNTKFQTEILKGIKADEDQIEKLGKEIKRIESGELDKIIIKELEHSKESQSPVEESTRLGNKGDVKKPVIVKDTKELDNDKKEDGESEKVEEPKFVEQEQKESESSVEAAKPGEVDSPSGETREEPKETKEEDEMITSDSKDNNNNNNNNNNKKTEAVPATVEIEDDEQEREATEEADDKRRSADTDSSQIRKRVKLENSQPNQKLKLISNPLIASIASYKYASTFLTPVNEHQAPKYYSLIKSPRDLKTIKAMVKDGRIQTKEELERDIVLMFANAIMYNKTGTDIYEWAKEMQMEVDKMLELFKNVDE